MALSAKAELNQEVGRRVRDLRNARGLTVEQLAALAGISPQGLRNLEAGGQTPGIDKLVAIAYVLNARVDEFVPSDYEPFVDTEFLQRFLNARSGAERADSKRTPATKTSKRSRREGGFSTPTRRPAAALAEVA